MLLIEQLDTARHNRTQFDCGVDSLNIYLRQYARQYNEKNIGVTWLAVLEDDPAAILGYYTLASGALISNELPSANVALPQIPILLLGRFAVDIHTQGQGIGKLLLMHALHHALYFSTHIGVHAVVVDALDKHAVNFYQQYGFQQLTGNPYRLYLSMKVVRKVLNT